MVGLARRRSAIQLSLAAMMALLPLSREAVAGGMTVSSPDIGEGATIADDQVLDRFGCTGRNISPALQWRAAPAATRSLAVTVFDPDAPTASGWWHWIVIDIPASVTGLARNAGNPAAHLTPAGSIQAQNDYGTVGWGGPCPPQATGTHRYVFTVYALDVGRLGVSPNASPARIAANIRAHAIDQASLTALYGRP